MPELLIVTRAFPPLCGAGVQRMVKFAVYLEDHGWKTTVVAPSMAQSSGWYDETQLSLFRPEQMIRVGRHSAKPSVPIAVRILKRFKPIDAHYSWSQQVIRQLRKAREICPDVVFTSGPPQSIHLVGQSLSVERKIPWVADFRDHYTLNPEYLPTSPVHRWIDKRFEQKILEQSSAVICNTRTNRRQVLAAFGVKYAAKVATIYNGFDREDLKASSSDLQAGKRFSNELTNYLYLGGLRGAAIDDVFFRMIQRLQTKYPEVAESLAIHVVGDPSRRGQVCDALVGSGVVQLHQPVPATGMYGVLREANACLTWQRDIANYRGTIAGKMFDYLAMEKPVFALGQEGGEVDKLLSRFGLGVCVNPADTNRVTEQFVAFHNKVASNDFRLSQTKRCPVDHFSRQYQAGQLAQLLEKVTA